MIRDGIREKGGTMEEEIIPVGKQTEKKRRERNEERKYT